MARFKVRFSQRVMMVGRAIVEAETIEEAERIASRMPDKDIAWDYEGNEPTIVEHVEPC